MGVIKGQNLRIKLGTKYVAFATSCTVHVSAQLEESSTKDSTNGWQQQEITGMKWDISVDALYSVDTDATGVNGSEALDLILAQQKIAVEFTQAAGEKNRVPGQGAIVYSGNAWVNDVSVNAPNRQNTTYTLQAAGDGELTKGA
jgi:predicted secreted protein